MSPAKRAVRILLVEDNPADAYLVRQALREMKLEAEFVEAHDGGQAIKSINSFCDGANPRPDVILLDLTLPRESGDEVVQYLRKNRADAQVPVIVMTSLDSPQTRTHLEELGI